MNDGTKIGFAFGNETPLFTRDFNRASLRESPQEEREGSGTGFFVDQNGTVLTSYHVVAKASQIEVTCSRNEPTSARVLMGSESTDLALLSTNIKSTSYLTLAHSKSAAVGQDVFTYGFPVSDILGKEPKLTTGVVSSLSGIGGEHAYMQISVPVQPGNSGGPVVTESGEVVGIVASTAAVSVFLKNTGALPQNVNWAVKAEYASLLLPSQPPQVVKAKNRMEAVRLVGDSLCLIRTR